MIIKSSAFLNEVNDTKPKRIPWTQFFTGTIYFFKQEYKTAVDEYMDPAIVALKEMDEDSICLTLIFIFYASRNSKENMI